MREKIRIKISLPPIAFRALVDEADRAQESKSRVIERLLRELDRKQEQENVDGN